MIHSNRSIRRYPLVLKLFVRPCFESEHGSRIANRSKLLILHLLATIACRTFYFLKFFFHRTAASRKNLRRQAVELDGKGIGRTLYLIATGPSLLRTHIPFGDTVDHATLSNGFLYAAKLSLSPAYQFFTAWHYPVEKQSYLNWISRADLELPETTIFFFMEESREDVKHLGIEKKRKVIFLATDPMPFSYRPRLDRPLLRPQSIPILALHAAMAMKYKRVVLVGCDHNILLNFGDNIRHAYNNDEDMRKGSSDKDAWLGIIENHWFSLNVFLQYKYLLDECRSSTMVYRATSEGWLDFVPPLECEI